MAVRILLVLGAVTVVVFAGLRLSDHRACEHAAGQAFVLGARGSVRPDPQVVKQVARDVVGRCRGARPLTAASEALGQGGHPVQAAALAREAVRREPEWWLSWRAQAAVFERRGDQAGARRARGRSAALNPRRAQ